MGNSAETSTDLQIERVLKGVEALKDELVDAVSAVIQLPSVNPRYPGQRYEEVVGGEGEVARFLGGLYEQAGCELEVFGAESGRNNCVGVLRGRSGGRSLIFNGHVDVVPPGNGDEWTSGDPWDGRVDGGRIWGRGACDMKGGLVAQAIAAKAVHAAEVTLRGDLILEAVVGEEMMEHELGTSACIARGYRADAAVVAEPSAPPTPLAVAPVTAGVMSFTVRVEGKATHPSMRGASIHAGGYGEEVGVNAIDKAMVVYDALRSLERDWGLEKRHPFFPPGHFAIMPGVFVGAPRTGQVPFFIPDQARLDYVVIYHPDDPPESVREEIEDRIAGRSQLDGWLRKHRPVVEWLHHWPRSALDPAHPIVKALADSHERASGEPATVAGFAAVHDATFLNAAGIPALSYGPGDLRVAHAADEHVQIDELVAAAKTYAALAVLWCGA